MQDRGTCSTDQPQSCRARPTATSRNAPIALSTAHAPPHFHFGAQPRKMLDSRHANANLKLAMPLERPHHPRPVADGANDSARTTEIPPMSSLFISTID